MAPTELTILSAILLPPAPLPSLISLKAFTELFPRKQQSSPQIRTLYRDLQRQRARLIDAIAQNIATETKRGKLQRRAVVQTRKADGREEQDDEVDIEHALFGPTSNLLASNLHTLMSIIPKMESAAGEVEDEVRRLEEEAEVLLEEMRGTVGGLSDLRYGRLANGQLREQVLEGLNRLERSCKKT